MLGYCKPRSSASNKVLSQFCLAVSVPIFVFYPVPPPVHVYYAIRNHCAFTITLISHPSPCTLPLNLAERLFPFDARKERAKLLRARLKDCYHLWGNPRPLWTSLILSQHPRSPIPVPQAPRPLPMERLLAATSVMLTPRLSVLEGPLLMNVHRAQLYQHSTASQGVVLLLLTSLEVPNTFHKPRKRTNTLALAIVNNCLKMLRTNRREGFLPAQNQETTLQKLWLSL